MGGCVCSAMFYVTSLAIPIIYIYYYNVPTYLPSTGKTTKSRNTSMAKSNTTECKILHGCEMFE